MGVEFIPCQMTMDMFGLKREDIIDGLGEPAGAATVIELMTQPGTASLFIYATPTGAASSHDRTPATAAAPHPASSTPAAASARAR